MMESDFGSGHVVELCPGGSQVKVTKDSIDSFISCYVEKYFKQDETQFAALMRGVESVCGKLMLKMLSEQSAEARGCSSKQISWQAFLRQVTFDPGMRKKTKDGLIWCLKQMSNHER